MKENNTNNYFESRFKFDLGRKKVWDAIVDHLQPKFFNNIETVVELGCGYGDFINFSNSSFDKAILFKQFINIKK